MAVRRTLVAVALVLLAASAAWGQDAMCSRCGQFVRGVGEGQWFGMIRTWRGLCGDCRDPERRCDRSLEALRERIQETLAALATLNQEEAESLASGSPDPLWLEAIQATQQDLVADLAHLRALLARLEQECSAQRTSDAVDNLNPGGAGAATGSNEPRDAPTGSGPVQDGADVLDSLNPGGAGGDDGSNVGRDAPTGRSAQQASSGSLGLPARPRLGSLPTVPSTAPQAAYLQGLHRYSAWTPPAPRPVVRSEDGLPEPAVAEKSRGETPLDAAGRHAANARGYAEAFDLAEAEASAAWKAGERDRALRLLEHGLWLLAAGQSELRDAARQRVRALRALLKLAKALEGPPGEAIERWQAEVRAGGLPPMEGLSPEETVALQEELLAIDPRDAGRAHHRLALEERTAKDAPLEDAEWDVASVRLSQRLANFGR